MRSSHAVSVGLLLSAFSPLIVVLLLVAQPFDRLWSNLVLAAIGLFPLPYLAAVLHMVRTLQLVTLDSEQVRRRDVDVLSFMATFVVPLSVAAFADDALGQVAAVALAVVLAAVYVRSQLHHLNPVLAVLGYHLYEVTGREGRLVMVLSRSDHLPQVGAIHARPLGGDVYLTDAS